MLCLQFKKRRWVCANHFYAAVQSWENDRPWFFFLKIFEETEEQIQPRRCPFADEQIEVCTEPHFGGSSSERRKRNMSPIGVRLRIIEGHHVRLPLYLHRPMPAGCWTRESPVGRLIGDHVLDPLSQSLSESSWSGRYAVPFSGLIYRCFALINFEEIDLIVREGGDG